MTDLRTSIVRNSNLQRIAKELGLDGYLLHPQLQTIEDSALSDVCEALIGAIFIDGDLQAAKSFITKFVLPHDVQTDHEHQFHSFELPYYAKVSCLLCNND
jgi:dsRNA-specific ribonuclease